MNPSDRSIRIRGASTNNLRRIDVDIPRQKITAIVGVSGAGKTSLAFGTVYAEGYLRYIESISPYIRQFLDKIEKPPVDLIDGLPPAIAFRHRKPAKNPRSIVATSSDLYDYIRIVYAKISDFFCPQCGGKVEKFTIDEIVSHIMKSGIRKVAVCFEYTGEVAFLVNRGYYFLWKDGKKRRVGKEIHGKTVHVLLDHIEVDRKNRSRIFEAIDRSMSLGRGFAVFFDGTSKHEFPTELFCTRCQKPYDHPDENLFSFNSPRGACPRCKGFGDLQRLDPDLIFDTSRSIADGAIRPLSGPAARHFFAHLLASAESHGIDIHRPVGRLTEAERDYLLEGGADFPGINGFFESIRRKSYKVQARVFLSRYTSYRPCDLCAGSRLNGLALSFRFKGNNIAEVLNFTIAEARSWFVAIDPREYRNKISATVFDEIRSRLDYLFNSGLGYIHLNRHTFTLSQGEFQRINLAFILGSVLSDSLLIIDQPSSDLHPHDYRKLTRFFTRLRSLGNTLLLVEHNRDIVSQADCILELGPRSGKQGGRVMFMGSRERFFKQSRTLTQISFNRPATLKSSAGPAPGWYKVENADSHNLKHIHCRFPKHRFTVITGVSGSGKTTLLFNEIFGKRIPGAANKVFIDPGVQKVKTTTNIAGFFEIFTPLREFFARLKESQLSGYLPGHFSFNSPLGRCEECRGSGSIEMEMQFLPPVKITCSGCRGLGYKPEVLRIKFEGHSIQDVLELSIDDALELFTDSLPKIRPVLENIRENGMGYLKLGQRLSALSLGELQRLKLMKYLHKNRQNTLFLIDEPSFGLHPYDIEMLTALIDRIVANHNTVIAADHNFSLLAHADHIIDLGPEGGDGGGRLIYEGDVPGLLDHRESTTARYLRLIVKHGDRPSP